MESMLHDEYWYVRTVRTCTRLYIQESMTIIFYGINPPRTIAFGIRKAQMFVARGFEENVKAICSVTLANHLSPHMPQGRL